MNVTKPVFKTLNPKHRKLFDKYTKGFPPYCDYSFSTQMNWSSPKYPTRIAIFNDNLLLRLKDFNSDKIVTLFIGRNDVPKTVETLLDQMEELSMVPEEVINEIKHSDLVDKFCVEEDYVNNEYIMDLQKTATLSGKKLKSKRSRAKFFSKKYPCHTIEIVDKNHKKLVPEIINLITEWAVEKCLTQDDIADEIEAVKKLLNLSHLYNLMVLCIREGEKLIAYTTNEIKGEMVHGGFGKALRSYKGIYAYLEQITAKQLLERGAKYINIEQDLGLPGLRSSKRTWRPVKILKKYIIRKKQNA